MNFWWLECFLNCYMLVSIALRTFAFSVLPVGLKVSVLVNSTNIGRDFIYFI